MNLSRMKAVDRALGPFLCGLVRAGYALAPPRPRPAELRRILVIKFWGMGGLILTAPLLQSLRAAFPSAEIHLATLAQNREVAEWLGQADALHLLELSPSPVGTARQIFRFLEEIRAIQADAALDLEYLTRFSALVAGFSRAPLRAGFAAPGVWRGDLHNLPVAFRSDRHVSDNFLQLAEALGAKADEPVPAPARPDRKVGEELLRDHGLAADERVIVVNPNAGELALERRWPAEHFTELLDRILQADLGRVVLIGAPDEQDFVRRLQQSLASPPKVLNLAGQLTFRQLAGLLARADLLITNDSGPLHLAALLGTPTLSFFGPETPILYGPTGPQHSALFANLPCSPCIRLETAKTVRCLHPRPECLYSLTPDQAWTAVLRRGFRH
jgi:ADP-heptose:LPS heptosyltransferase